MVHENVLAFGEFSIENQISAFNTDLMELYFKVG